MKHTLLASIIFALVSTSAFGQWTRMNFTYGADPFVAVGENTASSIIFAGNINGIYRSTDNGVSWALASSQLANLQVDALAVTGANTSSPMLFAGTFGSGMYLSIDSGATWNPVDTGLPKNAMVAGIAVAGSAASPMIFISTAYSNAAGVFLSTDNGAHWNTVNNGLTTLSIFPIVSGSSNFSSPMLLAAGTGNDTIYLTTNNGVNWDRINNGLPYYAIFSLAVLDTITSSPIIFSGTWGGGVFRSTNDGTSWDQENNGLTDLSIYSLATYGTNLFAGTDSGIFLSTDSGATWRSESAGLSPNNSFGYIAVVGSILFAESDSVVDIFGDDTAFAWRRPISDMLGTESMVAESQTVSNQLQMYPNPANGLLHFASQESDVIVTDLLGRVCLHALLGTQDLDVSKLCQGVYFVHAKHAAGVAIEELTITR